MQVSIKDVNDGVFREFKAESVRKGLKVGQAMTLAMQTWLQDKKPKLRLLNFTPTSWGKGTERTSVEIDDMY